MCRQMASPLAATFEFTEKTLKGLSENIRNLCWQRMCLVYLAPPYHIFPASFRVHSGHLINIRDAML